MPRRFLLHLVALMSLGTVAATCQEGATPSVVQPGAPGHSTTRLTSSTTGLHQMPPTVADTQFMQGMIMHHGQAVEMCELVKTHSQDPAVLDLGRRIGVSQTSEMAFMKLWLSDRGLPLTEAPAMGDMAGMDMSNMAGMDMSMPMMPGMLTPQQMDALRKATGPEFDHLFLTGMIQHHTGALTMVKQLFAQPAAGQDAALFDFANDVDNTQLAEIDLMRRILKLEKH